MPMRADLLLVQMGLARSRSQAQRLIASGAEWCLPGQAWQAVSKNSDELPASAQLRLLDPAELRYVSRGGLKLQAALEVLPFPLQGLNVLDVGQSTGGFTDCVLQAGAAQVVGVDVGHDQLHPCLRQDPRVKAFEGINARTLSPQWLAEQLQTTPEQVVQMFHLVVADVSFVSLTLVMPHLNTVMNPQSWAVLLIKPQFELSPADIGKGGLVKSDQAQTQVKRKLLQAATALGWDVVHWMDSPITGGDGNREYFLIARKGCETRSEA